MVVKLRLLRVNSGVVRTVDCRWSSGGRELLLRDERDSSDVEEARDLGEVIRERRGEAFCFQRSNQIFPVDPDVSSDSSRSTASGRSASKSCLPKALHKQLDDIRETVRGD